MLFMICPVERAAGVADESQDIGVSGRDLYGDEHREGIPPGLRNQASVAPGNVHNVR
jgi:hypothetical protein